MTFELPKLPYSYDSLSPYMSLETLQFHHDKHHKAYVDNGNKLLSGSGLENLSVEEVIRRSHSDSTLTGLFNNAAQHYNHVHFWRWLKKGSSAIPGTLAKKIDTDFGSLEAFKTQFIQAGVTQFGSGWCWLALKSGRLVVMKTPNGENPLVHGATPLLGCDVWEHSYYIDYRNARPDYLKAFTEHLINWEYVGELFEQAN